MTAKAILKGCLEFGTLRSFDQAVKQFANRAEVYYKNDVLLKQPTVFDADTFRLHVNLNTAAVTDKCWRNTLSLLECMSQYAVAGGLHAWLMDTNNPSLQLQYHFVEPVSDKEVVQSYLQGRQKLEADEKEDSVLLFTKAIERFPAHAFAYERRGYAQYLLQLDEAALQDFDKAIAINPELPEAYVGRAMIYLRRQQIPQAIEAIANATKVTIPAHWVYWRARLIKADCLLSIGNAAAAAQDLKYFTKRTYVKTDPNYAWRKFAFYKYAAASHAEGDTLNAINAIEACLAIKSGKGDMPTEEELLTFKASLPPLPKATHTTTKSKTVAI